MGRLPELLAPVGGPAQLHAAVNNGADAVYLGGVRFNARGKAENFTLPRLRDAIRYAHERDVKIYVTFNTLLKDRELPEALEYAGALWDIGADAVIVQDMGLVRLLGKYLPRLPLHMSTQGTVTGKWAVDLMKDLGIRRIVPARELSLREIREMAEVCHRGRPGSRVPTCELEVFVHGALCMCYSGQCQMSRILGSAGDAGSARSGNRGLCAQPCRLPYTDDQGRTGYFLSPKDLCLLEDIPALCEAGVDSLKIEGRLKSPEYVAVVTGIYRKYLDQYARTGTVRISSRDRQDLTQIYNRGGFTKGYLYGDPGERILSGDSPKNTGIYIGKVHSVVDARKAGQDRAAAAGAAKKDAVLVDVTLRDTLEEGDGVEFRPANRAPGGAAEESGGTAVRFEVKRTGRKEAGAGSRPAKEPGRAGGVVTFLRTLPGGSVRIGDMKGRISSGDRVFRISRRTLLDRARETFDAEDTAQLDRMMKQPLPLSIGFEASAGRPAVLTIREGSGKEGPAVYSGVPAPAVPGAQGEADAFEKKDAIAPSREVRVMSRQAMEEAHSRPADPDRVLRQLQKLGGTPFAAAAEDIEVALDGRCAIPVSLINRMRREGIDRLLQEKGRVDRTPADTQILSEACKELAERRLELPAMPEEERIPLMEFMRRRDRAEDPAEEAARYLPYVDAVSKGRLDAYIEERFDEIVLWLKRTGVGILLRGNTWIRPFLDAGVRVYGGHGLNVYNMEALLAYEEIGVTVVEPSHETGVSADGRIPLMITEHEVKSKTLTDRKGKIHQVGRSPSGDKTIIW